MRSHSAREPPRSAPPRTRRWPRWRDCAPPTSAGSGAGGRRVATRQQRLEQERPRAQPGLEDRRDRGGDRTAQLGVRRGEVAERHRQRYPAAPSPRPASRPRSPRSAHRTAATRRSSRRGPSGEDLLLRLGEQFLAIAAHVLQVMAAEVKAIPVEQLLGTLVAERSPLELKNRSVVSIAVDCSWAFSSGRRRRIARIGGESERRV